MQQKRATVKAEGGREESRCDVGNRGARARPAGQRGGDAAPSRGSRTGRQRGRIGDVAWPLPTGWASEGGLIGLTADSTLILGVAIGPCRANVDARVSVAVATSLERPFNGQGCGSARADKGSRGPHLHHVALLPSDVVATCGIPPPSFKEAGGVPAQLVNNSQSGRIIYTTLRSRRTSTLQPVPPVPPMPPLQGVTALPATLAHHLPSSTPHRFLTTRPLRVRRPPAPPPSPVAGRSPSRLAPAPPLAAPPPPRAALPPRLSLR